MVYFGRKEVRAIKVCILYYDGFCEFETVFTAALFKDHIISAGLEERVYISEEKQKFLPDTSVSQLTPEEIDLFFIPGGKPGHLFDDTSLKEFLLELNRQGKIIAGICGGTFLMAAYGLLEGKRCTGASSGLLGTDYPWFSNSSICSEEVVVDGNLVTATGQAYVAVAFTLARILDLYPDQAQYDEEFKWYNNQK